MAILINKFKTFCTECRADVPQGIAIVWNRGVKGVKHADPLICARLKTERQAAYAARPQVTANAKPVADFLGAARERGLKFPKVAFLGPNGARITMKLAGVNSTNPGAVFVNVNGEYFGSIATDGIVRGKLAYNPAMLAALETITTDPAAAAKAYAQVTGSCSFCAKELTDAGSIEVGYGPICARKYGLPHTAARKGKTVELPIAIAASREPLTLGMLAEPIAYGADPIALFDDPLELTA